MTLQEILPLFEGVSGAVKQYSARCPAHMDNRASLSIAETDEGNILLHCHAGCDTRDICEAIGIQPSDLFNDSKEDHRPTAQEAFGGKPVVIAEYIYTDLYGSPVAKKLRYSNKSFCWLKPDDKGGWRKGRNGKAPLYNQFNVKDFDMLYIVEGEKDVETLRAYNIPAISLPDGSKSKWQPEYTEFLNGRSVAIIQDNDEPGRAYAEMIAGKLKGKVNSIKVIDLFLIWLDMPLKADITDYINSGHDIDQLPQLLNFTNEWVPGSTQTRTESSISAISASDLQKTYLPPTKFLVDKILPEGTSMICAPSKIGKSWFVLDMGLAIASGTSFMKYTTNQNGVLYLALEDSLTRLKDRMNKILCFTQPPKSFYFATKAPTLDNNLLDEIDKLINVHPEIKLIIIDTLQKIRGLSQGREAAYAQDYREMGTLKDYADTHNISIFFVHHTRKMKDESDPFNMVSGTNGIMGVADTIFTMLKEKRQDKNAILHITGRDVEQVSDVVSFNTCTWRWETIGSQEQIQKLEELASFNSNPIVITIRALLDESKSKSWSGTCAELMEAGEQYSDEPLADCPQQIGYALRKLKDPLMRLGNIYVEKSKHGNAGKKYSFQLRAKKQAICMEST